VDHIYKIEGVFPEDKKWKIEGRLE